MKIINLKIITVAGVLVSLTGCVKNSVNVAELNKLRENQREIIPIARPIKDPQARIITYRKKVKAILLEKLFLGSSLPAAFEEIDEMKEGRQLVLVDHIHDPSEMVLPLLIEKIKQKDKKLHFSSIQSQTDIPTTDKALLTLSSEGWRLTYQSFFVSHFRLQFKVIANMMNAATHQLIWKATCEYPGSQNITSSPTLDQYKANQGALIKSELATGSAWCANELTNKLINAK